MSYELMPAGYLVSGPKRTEYAVDIGMAREKLRKLAKIEHYDEDDYTITAVYHLGWNGDIAQWCMPPSDYEEANAVLAGAGK